MSSAERVIVNMSLNIDQCSDMHNNSLWLLLFQQSPVVTKNTDKSLKISQNLLKIWQNPSKFQFICDWLEIGELRGWSQELQVKLRPCPR